MYTLAMGAVAGTTPSFAAKDAALLLLLKPIVEYNASRKEPWTIALWDSNTADRTIFDDNRMIVVVILCTSRDEMKRLSRCHQCEYMEYI